MEVDDYTDEEGMEDVNLDKKRECHWRMVFEDNEKTLNKGNIMYRKVCQFSRNGFWKNIGCLVSAPTFGLGGSRLWEKE